MCIRDRACTTAPTDTPATTTPPATSAASDNTAAVCAEATSYAGSASASVMVKYQEGAAALAANDLVKAQAAATEGKRLLGEWSTKFKSLSAQPIKPEVKTAIDNMTTFIDQTAAATTADPTALQATFTDLTTKLTTACASV